MPRIIKQPEIRKMEIIDMAQNLFYLKGYDKTSVNEIIEKLGIAKGTFYYYFKSKEEILDVVVNRFIAILTSLANEILQSSEINAYEKLKRILVQQANSTPEEFKILEQLHKIQNVDMHQKMIVEAVKQYAPVLSEVIEQGIHEGIFHTNYPLQAVEFFIAYTQTIMDPGVLHWSEDDYKIRAEALQSTIELLLGAQTGSFDYIPELYRNMTTIRN
jgi:AcrR family transcriptional regulator